MKIHSRLFVLATVFACFAHGADPGDVFFSSRIGALASTKARLAAGDATLKPALAVLVKSADEALKLTPPSVTTAFAELQWFGDPAKGRTVFDNLNFEGAERHSPGTGTITPAVDPVHGPIWRVHKPAADKRAEIRGAKGWSFHEGQGGVMQQGVVYYIGWRYKFTLSEITGKGWACFQWKSYPDPKNPASFTQNYPFTMGYNGRELSLTTHGENWQQNRSTVVKVWSRPVQPDTWVDVVLAVKPSLDKKIGYVEIYFNGELQPLLTGGTRAYEKTMDGLEVAPKWGAYNSSSVGTEITVDLADLRIGTDLASVLPKPVSKLPAPTPRD